jgi:hypothetical protein
MDERPWVHLERLDRPAPPMRPKGWVLAVAWLAMGALVVSHAQLPDLPAAPSAPARRPAGACWVVQVASRPASAPSLRRHLRRLQRAGLPASIRRGHRPGTRELVVQTRTKAAANAARARVTRLGFAGSTVRRLPRAACQR